MSVRVSPAGRDLIFDFKDSCNCRSSCFNRRREPHDNQIVYLNEKGELTRFDPKKTENHVESMARSIDNLQKVIEDLSEELRVAHTPALERIEAHMGERIEERSFLTWGFVKRVSDAINHVFYPPMVEDSLIPEARSYPEIPPPPPSATSSVGEL